METITATNQVSSDTLVTINALAKSRVVFDEAVSPRWIRGQMKRRTIPYFKIGGKVLFSPSLVRATFEKSCLVSARQHGIRRSLVPE